MEPKTVVTGTDKIGGSTVVMQVHKMGLNEDCGNGKEKVTLKGKTHGTSLEAQRLGLHLPVQGFRLITGQEARIQKTKTLNGGNIATNSIKDFKKGPHQIKVFLKKRKKTHSMNNLK